MAIAEKPSTGCAIVVAGGAPVDTRLRRLLPQDAYVVAADSGLHHAEALGLSVDAVVGDMDSVEPERLRKAAAAGSAVDLHPTDKDATDLELALRRVLLTGIRRVILIGGNGGRLDHLLGNALVLTAPEFDAFDVEWWIGPTRIAVVHRSVTLHGRAGDIVTLLAVGGPAVGVATRGLRWSLDHEDLPHGSTRGVSNEMTADEATVDVAGGTLLVFHERSELDQEGTS